MTYGVYVLKVSNTGLRWFWTCNWKIPVSPKVSIYQLGLCVFFLYCNKVVNFICFVHSASGCPIANRNKMRVMENYNAVEQHKAALAAATVGGTPTTKLENIGNCMTSGCDPASHLNGSFLSHRTIPNCTNNKKPIAKYPSTQTPNDLYHLYQKGLNSKYKKPTFSSLSLNVLTSLLV